MTSFILVYFEFSKLEEDLGGAAENSMACLGSNGQSETIPSDDANPVILMSNFFLWDFCNLNKSFTLFVNNNKYISSARGIRGSFGYIQ